jgi:hypothetical protein
MNLKHLFRSLPLCFAASVCLAQTETATQSATAPEPRPPKLHVEGFVHEVLQYENLYEVPDNFLMNTTRVTVRASGALTSSFEYKVGVVGRLNAGSKTIDNIPFFCLPIRSGLVPGAGPYLETSIASDLYVQEAYATLHMSRFYLRAGRQKVQNGTGYGYNPTDLFNRRVPLDPTYEADGYDAVAAGWMFSPGMEVQFLAAPRGEPAYRARFQSVSRGTTLALQFTSIVRDRTDWLQINTPSAVSALDAGTATVDDFVRGLRWNQVSAEVSRTVRGARLYAEAGFVFIEKPLDPGTLGRDSKSHERLLVGADYTFPSKVRVVAEYMRLGEGRSAREHLTLNTQLGFFRGEVLSEERDNSYFEISRPFSRMFSASLKIASSFNHPYVGLNPWVYFDPRPNLHLGCSLYSYHGGTESSYSNVGIGAFAEAKYTF